MERISLAGKCWAKRHRIALTTMHQRTVVVGKYPVEETLFGKFDTGSADDPGDYLVFRMDRWMLWHPQPHFGYFEIGTGHAKLTVSNQTLPETLCARLYRSATPLATLVELPKSSHFIAAANPRIIRADASRNGVSFLLRIDWTQFRPAGRRID